MLSRKLTERAKRQLEDVLVMIVGVAIAATIALEPERRQDREAIARWEDDGGA